MNDREIVFFGLAGALIALGGCAYALGIGDRLGLVVVMFTMPVLLLGAATSICTRLVTLAHYRFQSVLGAYTGETCGAILAFIASWLMAGSVVYVAVLGFHYANSVGASELLSGLILLIAVIYACVTLAVTLGLGNAKRSENETVDDFEPRLTLLNPYTTQPGFHLNGGRYDPKRAE